MIPRQIESSGQFEQVPLVFEPGSYAELFALKNNKSLAETFAHRRYTRLRDRLSDRYRDRLSEPLGEFLKSLKDADDQNYKLFLNKNGDLQYCRFKLAGPAYASKKGVYCYSVDDQLTYVGRCRDSMKKRIDQGYGKIHPKNCYIDGQSTNCHLNARIATVSKRVTLWLCSMDEDASIIANESALIRQLSPPWNVQKQ